ncbi:Hypothetical predicted protein [Pelobates cultripes]|uniref:Uncharacterized protein n=1 Tax=Pelobates cultripes TaxID=61616 RepID=A0AAD1SW55_PELCU|nr:Hypothetical predicted protein [Pelobates cultripes]
MGYWKGEHQEPAQQCEGIIFIKYGKQAKDLCDAITQIQEEKQSHGSGSSDMSLEIRTTDLRVIVFYTPDMSQ